MRVRKYRAWDTMQQIMVYELDWQLLHGCLYAPVGFELMEYTGLRDKNGVEVYENDIVYDHAYHFNLIVKWLEGKKEFLGSHIGWWLDNGYYLHEFVSHLQARANEEHANVTVLGNIYENPQLLKTVGSFGYNPLTREKK